MSDWCTIGLQLGISDDDLVDIEKNYTDVNERRRAMFRAWLKVTLKPTYPQLATALFLAKEEKVAYQICGKHGEEVTHT